MADKIKKLVAKKKSSKLKSPKSYVVEKKGKKK